LDLGPGEFEARLGTCRRCLDHLITLRPSCEAEFTALELGTGWYPTVPIGLYLCGASRIWSFDIEPLLRLERLNVLLNYFCDYHRRGRLQQFLPRLRPDRIARLVETLESTDHESEPGSLLERFNIRVHVQDARHTTLAANSIDLFFSYSVLEYIPANVLSGILAEFKRLSHDHAVMVHHIDLFDQYSIFDKSLTPLNFLKFSTRQWNWLRSPLTPTNRLRLCEYRSLISEAGFEIVKEINTSAPPDILKQIRVAREFEKFSPEDLLVLTSWVVARANKSRDEDAPLEKTTGRS